MFCVFITAVEAIQLLVLDLISSWETCFSNGENPSGNRALLQEEQMKSVQIKIDGRAVPISGVSGGVAGK